MSISEIDPCKNTKLVSYEQISWHIKNCGSYNNDDMKMMEKIINEMKWKGQDQLKLPDSIFIPLLVVYGIMIVFGAIGSFLVIFIVARNKLMRTPRNLFILNLAISDLILCSFTEPFNLLRVLSGHQEWNLGDTVCKMTSMLQGTNILVSTFSIMAIALDRFHVIVHPEKPPISTPGVVKILFLIWLLSIFISLPFYFFSKVFQETPKKCFEALDSESLKPLRVTHAYLMLILQYVVPVIIVSVTYFRICLRIKYRMVNQRDKTADRSTTAPVSEAAQKKRLLESRRQRKTNILLASLAIIFALSWLPLNTVNIVMDFRQNSFDRRSGKNDSVLPSMNTKSDNNFTEFESPSSNDNNDNNAINILSTQAICLLIVLCSACANPVLYGWLNENFKREFKLMFKSVFLMSSKVCKTQNNIVETRSIRRNDAEKTELQVKTETNKNCTIDPLPLTTEIETEKV